jgi:hypothetical protein
MKYEYEKEEIELTRKLFDLQEILNFQLEHEFIIVRTADYSYFLSVREDNAWYYYGCSLTPILAIVKA